MRPDARQNEREASAGGSRAALGSDALHRRREAARRRTHDQRRLVAGATLLLLLVMAGVLWGGGDDDGKTGAARTGPELPRGGRRILPDHRVVAYYGAPQDTELGALGVGRPAQAAARLRRQARPYRRANRPVLPAFELIAVVANASPGEDGDYSTRQPTAVISSYLRAARRMRGILILDVQPGTASFMDEVRALDPFLREPDVSLALDPEWSVEPGQAPGEEIGSTDAATVNQVSRHLAAIVRAERLPQKLLVVHRFTKDMIEDEAALERFPGVALTVNVDGFGDRPNKVAKYREFARGHRDRFHGFKLFYREDTGLMTPRHVLSLRPQPDLVVYE